MATACRIFDRVSDDGEAVLVKQGPVLGAIQARVIQRLAFECADRLSVTRAGRKNEGRTGRRMCSENRKHKALVILAEVEEAVPGENTVECSVQGQCSHIRDAPPLSRMALLADGDHFRRRIYAGYVTASLDEVATDWLAGPAANIENRGLGWQHSKEPVEPRSLHRPPRLVRTLFCPVAGVTPVKSDDPVGICGHDVALPSRAALE